MNERSEQGLSIDEPVQASPSHSRINRGVSRLLSSLWFGSAAFLLAVAAPSAFRAAGSPVVAASVVGTMLGQWHFIGVVLPLLLVLIHLRQIGTALLATLLAGITLCAVETAVDARIHVLRNSSPVPISSLDRSDPLRRRFGALHGISSLLLLAQLLAAAATVVLDTER